MCLPVGCARSPAFSSDSLFICTYTRGFFVFLSWNANTCSETFASARIVYGLVRSERFPSYARSSAGETSFMWAEKPLSLLARLLFDFASEKFEYFSNVGSGIVYFEKLFSCVENFHCFSVVFHQRRE